MSNKLLRTIGLETTKGALLHSLAKGSWGSKEVSLLTLSGAVIDQETFTLGGDVYEIHQINTDTTVNTDNGELANTNAVSTITLTGVDLGAILLVESEYMKVTYVGTTYVQVQRGYAGSTIASHANGEDIFKAAQAVATGAIPVPVGATLSAAAAAPLITAAVNASTDKSLPVVAYELASDDVLFAKDVEDSTTDCEEDFTNGTISAEFYGGVQPASVKSSVVLKSPSAAEVSAGNFHVVVPFSPTIVTVEVYDSSGDPVAWDGSFTVTGPVITVGNGGATDWAATSTVVVTSLA